MAQNDIPDGPAPRPDLEGLVVTKDNIGGPDHKETHATPEQPFPDMNRLENTGTVEVKETEISEIYVNKHINVTGRTFINVYFTHCTIERGITKEDRPTRIISCIFEGCQFTGEGWPEGWGEIHAMPDGVVKWAIRI